MLKAPKFAPVFIVFFEYVLPGGNTNMYCLEAIHIQKIYNSRLKIMWLLDKISSAFFIYQRIRYLNYIMSLRVTGKTFFTLFKLNITFYFKCYLHHNCSVNLNWNNTQLYSSAKPLHNVPSSVFWFVNFCFLSFLRRTSVQKWKKIWFCYVLKWIG